MQNAETMMKLIRKITMSFIFLFLSSCALFSKSRQENISKVQIGQTKIEIVEILGEPEKQSTAGGEEKWYYDIITSDQRRTDPYTAIFENGVLKRWYFDTARNGPPEPPSHGKRRSSKHDGTTGQ
jgi:outer membrane protein assembly factor BamE (lipoprotein component of BamABCDE complex)